jgi:hypothetical protein
VSTFQNHTKLCSKCSTLLVSSLNLSPVCWWKDFSSSTTAGEKKTFLFAAFLWPQFFVLMWRLYWYL